MQPTSLPSAQSTALSVIKSTAVAAPQNSINEGIKTVTAAANALNTLASLPTAPSSSSSSSSSTGSSQKQDDNFRVVKITNLPSRSQSKAYLFFTFTLVVDSLL